MKSAVETLTPTRVRLTVEVPFDELKPSVDAAYRKMAKQVRIQGFRPGKVPPRIIDQRIGRGAVIEEAVQAAIPRFYGDAVRDTEVSPLGHPEVDVTTFDDGVELVFTAEVDVRPKVELPAYDGLPVTVDDAEVDDDAVDEQLASLRDRFSTLTAVDRPTEHGDFVSIDLSATADGEPVPDGEATGLSYEVGSDSLLPGLDDALVGMTEGEARSFNSELVAGEYAGRTAQVAVTVRSVKVKQLPELDDEFAPTASEFDTLAELRADVRARLQRVRRMEQGVQARDNMLAALLAATEVPLPDSIVTTEREWRRRAFADQLKQAGISREDYLGTGGRTSDDLDAEIERSARSAVHAQLVLDAVADAEEVGIDDAELTNQIVRRAQRAGVPVDDYAQQLVRDGQLGSLMADIRRGKALVLVLQAATITDSSGRPVDLAALADDALGVVEAIGQDDDELDEVDILDSDDEELIVVEEDVVGADVADDADDTSESLVEAVLPGTDEDPAAGEPVVEAEVPGTEGSSRQPGDDGPDIGESTVEAVLPDTQDDPGAVDAVLEAELPGAGSAPA